MTGPLRSPVNGRLGRVLVVDDEPTIRRLVSLNLIKAGYEVVEAEDGAEAIATLNADDNPLMVDVILCDLRMPRINGQDAIAYFRNQYQSVPVVVLTGYPDLELAVMLLKQGVREYLIKPVTKERLLEVVQAAVARRRILEDQFLV